MRSQFTSSLRTAYGYIASFMYCSFSCPHPLSSKRILDLLHEALLLMTLLARCRARARAGNTSRTDSVSRPRLGLRDGVVGDVALSTSQSRTLSVRVALEAAMGIGVRARGVTEAVTACEVLAGRADLTKVSETRSAPSNCGPLTAPKNPPGWSLEVRRPPGAV